MRGLTSMETKIIQPINLPFTLLQVKSGYTNQKGEVYDKNGVFIDFPRELGSKKRNNLVSSSVIKRFPNKNVVCLIHERENYSYYHWTFETLPKLIYLRTHQKEIKIDKIYYHCGFWGLAYQKQALKQLGFNFLQLLDAKRIRFLQAKEIVVVKLNEERFNPSIELCQAIKSAFIKASTQEPFRRIYLTRDQVKSGRKVTNEIELRELLKTYKFQIIIPDRLSLADQAKLFNESKYIISPHGAALTNIVFCEPKTRILELFNQTNISTWNPLYLKIAEKCELELVHLGPKEMLQDNENLHRTNFVADLSLIKATLTDWGL